MGSKGRFYITTAIYYVNDVPHLGHAFEVLGIDIQARYRRMIGHDVFFLTGTDEHGQKVANVAEKKGITPREYANELVPVFQETFKTLGISYDDWVRTTDERHYKSVQEIWRRCRDRGDIYLGKYEGWYDVKEESYISDLEAKALSEAAKEAGRPDPVGTTIKRMSEDAYFFKLSAYADVIRKHIEANPDFVQPEIRRNEVLNSFLKNTPDICISRTTLKWGIPVPDEENHVVWVWFDALTNYLTGAGFGVDDEKFNKWWPADVHVIGKDISRFHTVIWPSMLISAGLEPPKQVFCHGFIEVIRPGAEKGEKMSKSAGNSIGPQVFIDRVGLEPFRYYLFREINYGGDGTLNEEMLPTVYKTHLADGPGNLLSRVTGMAEKYHMTTVKRVSEAEMTETEQALRRGWEETVAEYERGMPLFEYHNVLGRIWEFISLMDKTINDEKPWAMAKDPAKADRLRVLLASLVEGIRGVAFLIRPFMPETSSKMLASLGIREDIGWDDARTWGGCFETTTVRKGPPLFPPLEE